MINKITHNLHSTQLYIVSIHLKTLNLCLNDQAGHDLISAFWWFSFTIVPNHMATGLILSQLKPKNG